MTRQGAFCRRLCRKAGARYVRPLRESLTPLWPGIAATERTLAGYGLLRDEAYPMRARDTKRSDRRVAQDKRDARKARNRARA